MSVISAFLSAGNANIADTLQDKPTITPTRGYHKNGDRRDRIGPLDIFACV